MASGLIIPNLTGFRNALSPMITDNNSIAVLINLSDANYVLHDGVLYYNGAPLSEEEVFQLAANPVINKPLKDNLFVYVMFSYLYEKQDLRNRSVFTIETAEFNSYLEITIGISNFMLAEKLKELSLVYCVIRNQGVFLLLEVKEQQSKLIITSIYFHKILNLMLLNSFNKYGERDKYYCSLADIINNKGGATNG